MIERSPLAIRVREFREKLGLSQRELADLILVSHGTVGHWETGRQIPSVADIDRLAQAIEWEPQDIYFALGLIGTDQPRSAYEILAAFEREGRPLPRQRSVSRQKPWGDIGRTSRSNVSQDDEGGASQVRYRDIHIPGVFSHPEAALVSLTP